MVCHNGLVDVRRLEGMRAQLLHRGPDDQGIWSSQHIGLAHQRLSVQDLSAAGHQPMLSASGEWALVYNGEIYNAPELRGVLPGRTWRGHSDTEALLEYIAEFGVAAAARAAVGMFAYAAYHLPSKALYLVRDRLGIKPLYYGWVGDTLYFASELKAIRSAETTLAIDHRSVATYLRLGYIPSPATIYEDVFKLPPGHILRFDSAAPPSADVQVERYWRLQDIAIDGTERDPSQSAEALVEKLHAQLKVAVNDRLVADVSVGCFLSGGYDSSLVAGLMCEVSSSPVHTFTIGFEQARFNEAPHAERIAAHLGTRHKTHIVTAADLLGTIEDLPGLIDEPFADASILPTALLAKLTRQDVTVALSGDGGDELFWGYARYQQCAQMWARIARLPARARRPLASMLASQLVQTPGAWLQTQAGGRSGNMAQKSATLSHWLAAEDFPEFYQRYLSTWVDPNDVLKHSFASSASEHPNAYNLRAHWSDKTGADRADLIEQMAWRDTECYLPDNILTKVDRATMAYSLEARVPLLDHRVVEIAASTPDKLKHDGETSKVALRHLAERYLPRELLERPKQGFSAPIAQWLRGPLQSWSEELLSPAALTQSDLFKAEKVQSLHSEHLSGKIDNAAKLWPILVAQSWYFGRT